MVLGPARDLQSVTLDRVREHDGRPLDLGARRLERSQDVGEVVPAEVRDEVPQAACVPAQQPVETGMRGRSQPAEQRVPHHLVARREQGLVLLVGHLVDSLPQHVAALERKCLAQAPAVLELDHLPSGGLEVSLQLLRLDPRDDPVE